MRAFTVSISGICATIVTAIAASYLAIAAGVRPNARGAVSDGVRTNAMEAVSDGIHGADGFLANALEEVSERSGGGEARHDACSINDGSALSSHYPCQCGGHDGKLCKHNQICDRRGPRYCKAIWAVQDDDQSMLFWLGRHEVLLPHLDMKEHPVFCTMSEHLLQGPLLAALAMQHKGWRILVIPKSAASKPEALTVFQNHNMKVYKFNDGLIPDQEYKDSYTRPELIALSEETKFRLYGDKGTELQTTEVTNVATVIDLLAKEWSDHFRRAVRDRKLFSLVMWEHGAYFGKRAGTLNLLEQKLKDRGNWELQLLMEHTFNGQQKYDALGATLPVPACSCARTPVKALEDNEIGGQILDSIRFSVERETGQKIRVWLDGDSHQHVTVMIGIGRVGSGFARHWREKVDLPKEQSMIVDIPAQRSRLELLKEKYQLRGEAYMFNKESLRDMPGPLLASLRAAKLLFTATEKKPVWPIHINEVPEKCLFAGATSYDDEFGVVIHKHPQAVIGLRLQPFWFEKDGATTAKPLVPIHVDEHNGAIAIPIHADLRGRRGSQKAVYFQDGGLSANLWDSWDETGLWLAIIRLQYIKFFFFTFVLDQKFFVHGGSITAPEIKRQYDGKKFSARKDLRALCNGRCKMSESGPRPGALAVYDWGMFGDVEQKTNEMFGNHQVVCLRQWKDVCE